ncbi:hypothetical protein BN169_780168 [Clostridioides difficile E16]|nr:hypothetical protein BN169_780168 [Clostridioides difficile E16]
MMSYFYSVVVAISFTLSLAMS